MKAPVSGTDIFTVTGDDGVRPFINGVKVIDGSRDQGATAYTHTTTLTAGTLYNIELHYYEHEGGAACRLQWKLSQTTTRLFQRRLIRRRRMKQACAAVDNEEQFPYPSLIRSAVRRCLQGQRQRGLQLKRRFARLSDDFKFLFGEVDRTAEGAHFRAYTFRVTGDDGVRLFINGTKVIDGWRDQGATAYTYSTMLSARTFSDIELHYYEHEGDAACRLQWSYPGQGIQAIPQSHLFP